MKRSCDHHVYSVCRIVDSGHRISSVAIKKNFRNGRTEIKVAYLQDGGGDLHCDSGCGLFLGGRYFHGGGLLNADHLSLSSGVVVLPSPVQFHALLLQLHLESGPVPMHVGSFFYWLPRKR